MMFSVAAPAPRSGQDHDRGAGSFLGANMKDGNDGPPDLPLSKNTTKHWPRTLPPSAPLPTLYHKGDTPRPDNSCEAQERREAREYFARTAPTPPRTPGEADCWHQDAAGLPCLHPDGLGHVGPHGAR